MPTSWPSATVVLTSSRRPRSHPWRANRAQEGVKTLGAEGHDMGMPDAPWRFKPLMPSPNYRGLLITPMTKTAATVLEMLTGSLFSPGSCESAAALAQVPLFPHACAQHAESGPQARPRMPSGKRLPSLSTVFRAIKNTGEELKLLATSRSRLWSCTVQLCRMEHGHRLQGASQGAHRSPHLHAPYFGAGQPPAF